MSQILTGLAQVPHERAADGFSLLYTEHPAEKIDTRCVVTVWTQSAFNVPFFLLTFY